MKEKKYLEIIFYVLLFFVFLIYNLIICPTNLDEIWNYGFAHNIYSGLVPYKDFNMVITPLFPFLMSLPFFIFGSNMLVFHITNSLMLVGISYVLYKLLGNKAYFVILFLFLPLPISFPSYNIFLFFLLILIIYCEKKQVNDYLIGGLLALVCLTKQSVGVCLLLVSLYYLKDKKKLLKRFMGFLVPCLIFLLYLGVSKSFLQFFDLCLFGLFDFAVGNGKGFNIYWLLFIIIGIVTIVFIIRDKKNITNYYVLAFYSVLIPLFDTYHFQVLFLAFLLILIDKLKFLDRLNYKLFFFGIISGVSVLTFLLRYDGKIIYPNNIKHFEYRMLDRFSIQFTNEVNAFIDKNKDKNIMFLCSNGYYFRIVNDMKISYLDLINTGNWGYNGSEKLFNSVINLENVIFVVDEAELSDIKQTDKRILKYVMENGKKIDSIKMYDIYLVE